MYAGSIPTLASIPSSAGYDANSNLLTETGTVAYTASIGSSNNQIGSTTGGISGSYTYDAAGNTTGDGTNSYTFNQRGRMSSATTSSGTTSYIYNALGQLIEKSNGAGSAYLVYDESGHILGEYSSSGALIQETIWMGDTPVATLQANGSGISIYYIHTDHLGTPRKITDPSTNTVVWRWDPDTFGSVVPSITTIPYNLRFPGQYYQAETGLMYNYFRDYDPQTGRYIESDPIGLYGGSWSTYSYTNNNPISNTDSTGQADFGGLTGGVTPIEAQGASAAANFAAWWNTPDACIQAYLQRYFPTVAAHPGFSLLSAMSGPQNMFPGGPDAYVQDSIVMGGLKGLLSRMGKFVDWPLRIFGAATIPYATTANIEAAAHCASTCDQK